MKYLILLLFLLCSGPANGLCEGQEGIPIFGTIIEGQSPGQVVDEILNEHPDAVILAPEDEAHEIIQEAQQKPRSSSSNIKPQNANTLNTVLMYADAVYENGVYLLGHQFTWLQKLGLIGTNTIYLNQMSMKLGRWSQIVQWGEKKTSKGLVKLGIISQEKWQKRAEVFGRFFTHYSLCYGVYSLMQFMRNLPNFHEGFFSVAAQENILRKTSAGALSGFGWTLTARKWDALPDSERPISRQAFTTFNAIRGAIIGIFVPFLIASPASEDTVHFILKNSPFIFSSGLGAVVYFWGDPILNRFPQISRALESFDALTQRINSRMTEYKTQTVLKMKDLQLQFCNFALRTFF